VELTAKAPRRQEREGWGGSFNDWKQRSGFALQACYPGLGAWAVVTKEEFWGWKYFEGLVRSGGMDMEGEAILSAASAMSREQLLEQLRQAWAQIDRLRQDNEALKKQLVQLERRQRRGQGRRTPRGAQRRGKATGKGPHGQRQAPARTKAEREVSVPVEQTSCPHCGGDLDEGRWDEASTIDIAESPSPEVTRFSVQTRTCKRCRRKVRGRHPDLARDQKGATAHRVGDRLMAVAHTLHYGMGVPQRKVPKIIEELSGLKLTQGGLSQDASRRGKHLGPDYERLRARIQKRDVVHTDDTGWRLGGERAQMMVFTTEQGETLYQIRLQHRNEEVGEVLPSDWAGTMVTDRGRSYDAWQLGGVKQHKCAFHMLGSIQQVLEDKRGRARWFGLTLKELTLEGLLLWNDWRAGQLDDAAYHRAATLLMGDIDRHLRDRKLADPDNDRLLYELGKHHDRGNLYRFLTDPLVPPTNNLAEREVRFAVIARKVSQCSKTSAGARTREVLQSLIRTEARKRPASVVEAVRRKFRAARVRVAHAPTSQLDSS